MATNYSTQLLNFVVFSFFLFYFRDGYARQRIYRWRRERQRDGNCTRRPCYGSIRSVRRGLCWQEKPPPSLPQNMYLWAVRAAQGFHWVRCYRAVSRLDSWRVLRIAFPTEAHFWCGHICQAIISEMFRFCLRGRVFGGVKNMVIVMISELCVWFFFFFFNWAFQSLSANSRMPKRLQTMFVQSRRCGFTTVSFLSPWQWAHLLGASCTSLWGRVLLSWCWQRWLC